MEENFQEKEGEDLLKAAYFISLVATSAALNIIRTFPEYFRNNEISGKFFLDIVCLYLDIYHRLVAGCFRISEKNIPLNELVDKIDVHIGMVGGFAFAYINKNKEGISFLKNVEIELFLGTRGDFHDWAVKFKKIRKGKNSLTEKFVQKWVKELSISARKDFDRFSKIVQVFVIHYINDPRFKDILGVDSILA